MTTNLIIKRGTVVTLNGNKLSGNTYAVKDYIKAYLGGKWDAETKTWTVDLDKVNKLIAANAIVVTDAPVAETKSNPHTTGNWRMANGELNDEF